MRIASADRAEQLDATHSGHRDIADNDVNASLRNAPIGVLTIRGRLNGEFIVETADVATKDDGVVIDEEHGHTRCGIGTTGQAARICCWYRARKLKA